MEVSLFEALAEWVGQPAHFTAGAGRQPGRFGAEHATIAPYGPLRPAGDGTHPAGDAERTGRGAVLRDRAARALSWRTDPRFASNTLRVAHRDETDYRSSPRRFAALPHRESGAQAAEAPGWRSPVSTPCGELLEHPVLRGRDRWRDGATEAGAIDALLPPIDLGVELRMDAVPGPGPTHPVACWPSWAARNRSSTNSKNALQRKPIRGVDQMSSAATLPHGLGRYVADWRRADHRHADVIAAQRAAGTGGDAGPGRRTFADGRRTAVAVAVARTFWTGRRPRELGSRRSPPQRRLPATHSAIGVGCSPVDGLIVTAPLVVGEPAVRQLASSTQATVKHWHAAATCCSSPCAANTASDDALTAGRGTGPGLPQRRPAPRRRTPGSSEPLGQQSTPWAAQPGLESGAAVPVQRADRQRAPHSLRRGRTPPAPEGYPGLVGARTAAGGVHGRAVSRATAGRQGCPRFRVPAAPTGVRRRRVPRAGHSAGR